MDDIRIREIEKTLDSNHKSSAFIKLYGNNRKQALYDMLRVYDGLAIVLSLGGISQGSLGLIDADQRLFEQIHNLQDALNVAIQWIYQDCQESNMPIDYPLDEKHGKIVSELLFQYADPYAVIVDGFISYSRGTCSGRIEGNRIIFDSVDVQRRAFINGSSAG